MTIDYLHGRVLYKFLKRKNALHNFIFNVNKSDGRNAITDKASLLHYLNYYSISSAFTWYYTPEGDRYWRELDNEYESYYKKQIKVISVNFL